MLERTCQQQMPIIFLGSLTSAFPISIPISVDAEHFAVSVGSSLVFMGLFPVSV